MRLDKKAAGKRLRFILLDGLGSARIESDVDTGLLDSILARADA
jgi:3-dehydroquinate synthetase